MCNMSHAPETVYVVRDDLAYDTGSGDVIAVCPTRELAEQALARAEASWDFYNPEIVAVPVVDHADKLDWPGMFHTRHPYDEPWRWHEKFPGLVRVMNRMHPENTRTLRDVIDGKYVLEVDYMSMAKSMASILGHNKTMAALNMLHPRLTREPTP